MMPFGKLTTELRRRIDRGIDLAGDGFVCRLEGLDHVTERDITDDHNIHVALGGLPGGGQRTIQEGHGDPLREGNQMLAEYRAHADGLEQQALEFFEDGAIPINPEVDLVAVGVPVQNAGFDK